jgi:hypothetical protein
MNLATDIVSDISKIGTLSTYACRIARRLLLKSKCEEGHPVLAIEDDLIEMAKARFQEFLLMTFPRDDLSLTRLSAIVAVKRVAASKIRTADIDVETKRKLLDELNDMPMDDLISRAR